MVTDKLRSYGAAKSEIGLSARHDQGLRANNRAENSHQPSKLDEWLRLGASRTSFDAPKAGSGRP